MHKSRTSPQQRVVWNLSSKSGAAVACTMVRAEGTFNVKAAELALQSLADHYEILRTTFSCSSAGSEPVQVVMDSNSATALEVLDLQSLGPALRVDSREDLFERWKEQAFDLGRRPPFRASLVRLSDGGHLLCFCTSALCADSAGLQNLVEEFVHAYGNHCSSESVEIEPLQYADVARALNDVLDDPAMRPGRNYWERKVLEAENATAEIPFTKKGCASFAPRKTVVKIAQELARSIRQFAAGAQVPVRSVFLAGWAAALQRLADHSGVQIAVLCDGRNHPALKKTIGVLGHYLPFTWPSQDISFSEAVRTANRQWKETSQWQESYAPECRPEYFQYGYEYEERGRGYEGGGVRFVVEEQYVCGERFDLRVACVEQGEDLWAEFHYDSGRLTAGQVERVAGQWKKLVEEGVKRPESEVRELEVVGEEERQGLLAASRGACLEYERGIWVHERVAEQARKNPGATAVVCGKVELKYGELNERANRVANRLRASGAGAETLVGLCVERSVEMVVGILGILKAGAGYVPLDAGYPAERLEYLVEDSGVGLVLSQKGLEGRISRGGLERWFLDEEEEWKGWSGGEARSEVEGENVAYVIYTSGSTGRPKGVVVSHENLLHSTQARWHFYREPVKAFLLVSSYAFDSSVAGLFWTLGQGGAVHVPEEGQQRDGVELWRQIERHGISHLLSLPSLYGVVLEQGRREGGLKSLKAVIVAGESCTAELVKKHEEAAGEAELYNEYGPTEATVWSTVYGHRRGEERVPVPIGRAIGDAQVYVLEEGLRLAPRGVGGEICIGGRGVTRGYLRRAGLTAERYVPNPLSEEGGARLYRTGDLGRYEEDGEIEFLGRMDEQVKIRGYRIELGEIEEVLLEHAGVEEAAVVVRGAGEDRRLMGYWVSRCGSGSGVTGKELREWMKQKLPEYMVPGVVMRLEEMPRTANGKVDRKGLPEGKEEERSPDGNGPQRPVEEVVAGIWADVLGRSEGIGVEENFFELGGHSLLATQVISRLRAAFQLEITLPMLFEAPTVSGLGSRIEQLQREQGGVAAPPMEPVERTGKLPLSFAQQRLWFLDQLHPGNPFYNINTTVRAGASLNVGALELALQAIAERHEILRTRFPVVEGEPVQLIEAKVENRLQQRDVSEWPEAEREKEAQRIVTEEAVRPYDLAAGPLLRAMLVKVTAENSILLLGMHHIVSDGWSMGVLVRELTALYEAFREGRPSPLAPLRLQYADFAHWQREWLQGEVLEKQISYWRNQLNGAPPVLPLPTDFPRPEVQRFQGVTRTKALRQGLRVELGALARHEGASVFMVLLSAFQILLRYYTREDDVVVGSNIANRNRVEVEELIGFFINQLVLRTDLSGNPTVTELLRRTRRTTMDAYVHQDLSFDLLVAELQPERTMNRSPLYQVLFTLQNAPMPPLEIPGLRLTPYDMPAPTAKFDLVMTLFETESSFVLAIECDRDLFSTATIDRMLAQYEAILDRMVTAPASRIDQICDLLVEEEEQQKKARSVALREITSEKLLRIQRRVALQ